MILVTGSSGFIGTHLVSKFAKGKVCTVSRSNSQNNLTLTPNSNLDFILNGIESVVHLANTAHGKSDQYSEIYLNNVDATLNLFRQCQLRGVKKFIYISTANNLEGMKYGTVNYYQTKSKKIAEKEMLRLSSSFSMKLLIIRCPMIYGEDSPGNLNKLRKICRYIPLLPFKSVDNKISILTIDNLIDLIIKAVYNIDYEHQIFLATETSPVSISELINLICYHEKTKVIQISVHKKILSFVFNITGMRAIYSSLCCDSTLDYDGTNQELDWYPKYNISNKSS